MSRTTAAAYIVRVTTKIVMAPASRVTENIVPHRSSPATPAPIHGLDCASMNFSSARTRQLGFGVLCLVLAIVAGLTGGYIPLAVLLVVGATFIARGLTSRS
ncbi:MAG TPA: hypothetical protein VIJ51_09975 [Solirubrobacteraceae bacterium]